MQVMLMEEDEYTDLMSNSNADASAAVPNASGSGQSKAGTTVAQFPVNLTLPELEVSLAEDDEMLHGVCTLLLQVPPRGNC